jgi:hypothetical protein
MSDPSWTHVPPYGVTDRWRPIRFASLKADPPADLWTGLLRRLVLDCTEPLDERLRPAAPPRVRLLDALDHQGAVSPEAAVRGCRAH